MPKVCAVVVTYNRKDLLAECIEQLEHQSYPLSKIIIIDNASTDGTPELIKNQYPNVELLALKENIGGAGGFYEGIKYAYDRNEFDWLWILDDDTIAETDCLEKLIQTYNAMPADKKPNAMASRVVWEDNTLHPMNLPNLKKGVIEDYILTLEYNALPLRSSSFVSFMVNREMIQKYGLPLKKYFIWNDDVEYSSRILKDEFGVFVPDSIVCHKTKSKYTPLESSGNRYYFEARNKLWMLRTDSFTRKEKLIVLARVIKSHLKYLRINKFALKSIKILFKGVFDGLFKYEKEIY